MYQEKGPNYPMYQEVTDNKSICVHINDDGPLPKQETQVDLINKITDIFEKTIDMIVNTSNDTELVEKIRKMYAPFTIMYNITLKK